MSTIHPKKTILIGYGNVGKELEKILMENTLKIDLIVRSNGVFNQEKSKIDENINLIKYLDTDSCVFMCVPSKDKGESATDYYTQAFQKGSKIVTCEKAFLANNWHFVKDYSDQIKYSATVGGNSGILAAVKTYPDTINEIWAVVNGTLNYIGHASARGLDKNRIYKEVTELGFAEPGSTNMTEVIDAELKDVAYKAVILANHSGLYSKIITNDDIKLSGFKDNLGCSISLTRSGIKAGFFPIDGIKFPSGVNNILYINHKKVTEGPGAGGRATAERMFKDFLEFNSTARN